MRMRPVSGSLLLLGLAALLIAGCSGGGGGSAPAASSTQNVSMSAIDYAFNPKSITVKAGTPVDLTVHNTGTQIHDFTIDSIDGTKVSIPTNPGSTADQTFTPTTPGTYQFYCSQPGHLQLGMVGTLIVQ